VRFHWYWPFARREELAWAHATLRPGEEVVVQVVDRAEAPREADRAGVSVVRNLPDVDREAGGVRWAPSRAQTYWARARRRRQLWDEVDFDLVHLHYVNRFTDAWSKLPAPLVMSVHDVVPHLDRLGRRVEGRLLARVYRRPDAIVVHHRRLAERLSAEFGVDRSTIHVVPHQVFPVDAAPSKPPGDVPTVLFFGALRANKGLDVLEAALPFVGSEVRLTIAGHGEATLEQRAHALAARDPRVRAEIGFVTLERKRELFREASLVVLPYTAFASQSGVLHDAYGHGRPVVASDVGALGEAVREDGTGLVVVPNDPRALADAVEHLLEAATWQRCSEATARVSLERSPAEVGRRLRDVYDLLLT
jgi:glycosyltransferase involved in cell wall biosynthesis